MKPREWSQRRILAAVHAYVRREGRYPTYGRFVATQRLPSHDTVHRLYGGHRALQAAYTAQYGTPAVVLGRAGWVTCLRCGRRWASPDKVYQHCHPEGTPGCAAPVRPGEDGSWLTVDGLAVREAHWDLEDVAWSAEEST